MTIVSADHIAKWRGGITAALQRTAEEACWNRDPPLDLLVGAASSLVFKHAHGAVPPPPRVLEQAVLAYAGHPVPDPLASEQFYVGLPDFDVGAGHRASPAEQWWAQTVAEALARLRVHPDYCAEPERRRTIAAGMVSAFVQRYLPARQVAGDFWRTQDRWTSILHDAPLPGEAGALDQIEVSVGFFHRKASLLLVERHAETRAAHRLHVVDVGCRLGGYPMP